MIAKETILKIKSATVAIGLKPLADVKPKIIVGSGFLFDSAGYVMTAGHVLVKCQNLQKQYKEQGEKTPIVAYISNINNKNQFILTPINFEKISIEHLETSMPQSPAPKNMDIGYGKLSGKHNLPYLEVEPSKNEITDEILMCGYPGGDQTFSLTRSDDFGMRVSPVLQFGRISGFMAHDTDPTPYGIQTDIIGNDGSSGSPIINTKDGKVIGLAESVLLSYFESYDKTVSGKAKLGLVWGSSNVILAAVAKGAKNYFETGKNEPVLIPYTTYTLTTRPLNII